MVNDYVFPTIRPVIARRVATRGDVLAGNLSVQIDKLSSAGYIKVKKTFKGKRPCTICRITSKGQKAFTAYVEALKSYLDVKV